MSFSFLSDIQRDLQQNQQTRPATTSAGNGNESSSYWEKSGRPQYENGPGPHFPQLENAASQLTGSRMFTPLDGQQQQQQQHPPSPPPQQSAPHPMQQLQKENSLLRQQLSAVMQHLQQQQKQHQTVSGDKDCKGKRTTELLVTILLVLFIAVLVTLFAFCRKLTQQMRYP